MKRRGITIGPGAPSLLLVVVVVTMSILGLLALMSARSDMRLAQRSLEYTQAEYEHAAAAQRSLARLDGVLISCMGEEDYFAAVECLLPEGMYMEEHVVRWTEAGEKGRSLCCAVEVLDRGQKDRFRWVEHQFVPEENTFLP